MLGDVIDLDLLNDLYDSDELVLLVFTTLLSVFVIAVSLLALESGVAFSLKIIIHLNFNLFQVLFLLFFYFIFFVNFSLRLLKPLI